MNRKVLFSEWKIKKRKYRLKRNIYYDKKKIVFRKARLNKNYFIEEGIILEHYTQNEQGEWKKSQQHLIGYHYFCLINKKTDVFGFQGYINNNYYGNNKGYRFFYDYTNMANTDFKDGSYKQMLNEFNELLKKWFNAVIITNKTRKHAKHIFKKFKGD